MSEENKGLSRKSFETVWSEGDLAVADQICAPDYVAHIANIPTVISGVEQFKQFVALFRALSPDLQFEVEDQIAEGDKVATRWTARTRGAEGLAALVSADGEIEVAGITIHRVAQGRLAESWDNWDAMTAFQALGQDVFEQLSLSL